MSQAKVVVLDEASRIAKECVLCKRKGKIYRIAMKNIGVISKSILCDQHYLKAFNGGLVLIPEAGAL
jgi:hypothetical protein